MQALSSVQKQVSDAESKFRSEMRRISEFQQRMGFPVTPDLIEKQTVIETRLQVIREQVGRANALNHQNYKVLKWSAENIRDQLDVVDNLLIEFEGHLNELMERRARMPTPDWRAASSTGSPISNPGGLPHGLQSPVSNPGGLPHGLHSPVLSPIVGSQSHPTPSTSFGRRR